MQFNGSWMQEDRRHPSFCRLLRCSKAFVLQERVRSLMQQSSRALDSVTDNQLHESVAEPAAIGRVRLDECYDFLNPRLLSSQQTEGLIRTCPERSARTALACLGRRSHSGGTAAPSPTAPSPTAGGRSRAGNACRAMT